MATLKEALNIAKTDPGSEKTQRLLDAIAVGKFDQIAMTEGIDLSSMKKKMGVDVGIMGGTVAPIIAKTIESKKQEADVSAGQQKLKENIPFVGGIIGESIPKAQDIQQEQKIKESLIEKSTVFAPTMKDLPVSIVEKMSAAPINVAKFLDDTAPFLMRLTLPTVTSEEIQAAGPQIEKLAEDFRLMTGVEKTTASDLLSSMATYLIPAGGGAKMGGKLFSVLNKIGPKTGALAEFLGASLGATTGLGIAAEGKIPSGNEFLEGLLFDVATGGIAKGFKKILPKFVVGGKSTPKVISDAKSAGIKDDLIKLMQVETPGDKQTLQELFEIGLRRIEQGPMSGNILTETPLDKVVGDLDMFSTSLSQEIDNVGSQIGKAVDSAAEGSKTVNLTPVTEAFNDILMKVNATVGDDGIINFSESRLKRDSTGQKLLQEIYDFANKGDVSIKSAVEEYRSIGDAVFRGKGKVELSKDADILASKMRKMIQDPVVNLGGNLGDLNKKYSSLLELEYEIKKRFGTDATEVPSILRRMFGNNVSAKKINNLFESIDQISKDLGISEGQNLGKKTGQAIAIQDLLNIEAPTSLAPTIEGAVKKGVKGELIEKGLGVLFKKPEVIEAVRALLEAPVGTKEEILKGILPKLELIDMDLAKALRAILISGEEEETQLDPEVDSQ